MKPEYHAVCPCCLKITEWTEDDDTSSDPNEMFECDHCGCMFPLHYADFTDEEEDDTE